MRDKAHKVNILRIILFTIVILDLGYSFYQHHHMPLGGDMGQIIVPTPDKGYYKVLHDPFGLGVLLRGEVYSSPNRFFAHWMASTYIKNIPLLLQNLVEPIESVYLSIATIKIIIQFLIIYLLALYITNRRNPLNIEFLTAATLLFPLFQTSGYNDYMGVIDKSAIYTMFYSLSMGLLLLFYLPAFRELYHNIKPRNSITTSTFLCVLALILSLHAAIIPGVVLIVSPLVLLVLLFRNYRYPDLDKGSYRIIKAVRSIPGHILISFILISMFCLYSLYIAKGDAMSMDQSIPLAERYSKLPMGLYYVLTSKLGFPILIFCIIINILLIRKYYFTSEGGKIIRIIKWIGIIALIYLLLLPLGGYRAYREYIIRYDTFIPVTIGIMFVFGASSFYLVKNMRGRIRMLYYIWIAFILLIFTISDRPDTEGYLCERTSLEIISNSEKPLVELDNDCHILDWRVIHEPSLRELDADLLYLWNITDIKRLFYQKK